MQIRELLRRAKSNLGIVPVDYDDIFDAILARDDQAIKRIGKSRSLLSSHDDLGLTPLHFAAQIGCVESVEALIQLGADVNARSTYGSSALMEASSAQRTEIVSLLLNNGADPFIVDERMVGTHYTLQKIRPRSESLWPMDYRSTEKPWMD